MLLVGNDTVRGKQDSCRRIISELSKNIFMVLYVYQVK